MGSSETNDLRVRLEEVIGPTQAEELMRRLPEGEVVTKEELKAQFAEFRRELNTDLERFATKEDLERFATKEDLKRCATKEEFLEFRGEMREELVAFRGEMREEFAAFRGEVRVEMRDLMREQTRLLMFAMIGTMITLTGAVTVAQTF